MQVWNTTYKIEIAPAGWLRKFCVAPAAEYVDCSWCDLRSRRCMPEVNQYATTYFQSRWKKWNFAFSGVYVPYSPDTSRANTYEAEDDSQANSASSWPILSNWWLVPRFRRYFRTSRCQIKYGAIMRESLTCSTFMAFCHKRDRGATIPRVHNVWSCVSCDRHLSLPFLLSSDTSRPGETLALATILSTIFPPSRLLTVEFKAIAKLLH